MCGIWGIIKQGELDFDAFAAMARAFRFIAGRGPDARDFKHARCFGHSVLFAHSRLSIIELSALGAQPMVDAQSGWWIVFNGEIYNYPEIRDELRRAGQAFLGASDTEVLLRAWVLWGQDALHRFNGMFAFAAFNQHTGEVWLVRDRFGVKPLVWGVCPNGDISFGSSVAAIAEQVGTQIDAAYCARGVRYKAYETARSGSPFKKVATVSPGCWIRFNLSHQRIDVTEGRWYCLKAAVAARRGAIAHIDDAALVDECRQLFDSAVKLRLRSDVPVAVSLSAGLDSASIACFMSRRVAHMRAFTFGSPADSASEGPGAQAIAKATGIDVTYIWPQRDRQGLCDMLEQTMAFQEAPFSSLSPIAQNDVFRAVSESGIKVLLGGQGGDEIFAGYRKFFVIAVREALFQGSGTGMLRLLYSLAMVLAHEAGQARMYWQNIDRYKGGKATAFHLLDWEAGAENLWGDARMPLFERQIEDIEQWSLPTLLRYEDRNSMGYGVETRLPFMDYRLVELALALPTRMKIANGYGKWTLRGMTAGLVPDAIRLNRKKRGFDVTQDWVARGIGASLRARIFDNRTRLSGALDTSKDLDSLLSDAALSQHPGLLDEALLLAWLVDPTRMPTRLAARAPTLPATQAA